MIIYKAQNIKYKYAIDFNFNYEYLNYMRTLKIKYGYANINYNERKWRFNDMNIMNDIVKEYPHASIHVSMQEDAEMFERTKKEMASRIIKAKEIKESTDSDIKIEGIKGELYPYQKVGVEFFVNNNGRAMLTDDMGIGKSFQALAYAVHTNKKKTLVICPASVKYAWESEVKKWTSLKSSVIDSKDKEALSDEAYHTNDIFIINYDILVKFSDLITSRKWNCLIADEFHYIKNTAAKRTKEVKKIAKEIQSILLLSGTPILNRPVELFNGLNLIDPTTWNDWYGYVLRYCGAKRTRFGLDTSRATNIEELQEKISHYFLRRKKSDVLTELPPKQFIDRPVMLDKESAKNYDFAEESFVDYLREIKGKKITSSQQAGVLVKLNELRQICSRGKIYAAKDLINEVLDSGQKIVVFSVYNEPLKQLKEYFGEQAVMIIGSTGNEERRDIINDFQNNPDKKVFLGGMKSAGAGITLTAASNVLFIDYSFVPADHWQAADRIHRIGQKAGSVSIYQLYSKNTIDEKIQEILEKKKELFEQLIDGKKLGRNTKKVNLMNDVLKTYKEKR